MKLLIPALATGLISISAFSQPTRQWQLQWPTMEGTPSPRNGAAFVYDTDRQEMILIGGHDGNFPLNDIWTFDCQWRQKPSTPFGARSGMYVAYDTVRHQLIVFGGYTGDPYHPPSDMYIRNSDLTWTPRLGLQGPTGRSGGACAFDSNRGVMVIQGGSTNFNEYTDETWEWDGTAWNLKATGGPGARVNHQMVFDSWRGRCVLFGKEFGIYGNQETWEWDGLQWTLASTIGPQCQRNTSMAFDSKRGRTVLYGGVYLGPPGGASAETWEWDGQTWAHIDEPGIQPRNGHAMVFDPNRTEAVFLFGGQGTAAGSVPIPGLWFRRGGCPADINRDGEVDFFDYLDFVDAFSAEIPLGDFNIDCEYNFFDYLEFVDAFSIGC